MVEVIDQHDGVLDKFIGDAVMALYGVPFPESTDADRALATASGMMEALQHLNVRRASRGERPLASGVGINTGEVVLGNIGSPKRMDYTVIGDGVNLAARLEAATKTYGVSILLSEFTVEALNDRHGLREIDAVRVKGKKKPVRIFESQRHFWNETPRLAEVAALSEAGLGHFRAREWDQAERAFADALKLRADDRVAAMYLGRIADYRASPPPENWDGVYVMKSK
jgi:adenylate cyclase